MNTFSKKVVSAVVAITTVVSLTGAGSFVASAQTPSIESLQAMIAQLTAQIAAMQNSSVATSATSFSRDLTVGSKGADVTALQQVLASKGFLTVAPTGYFGSMTKAAVVAWQKSAGITPASGYVGPKSRAALNAVAMPSVPSNTTPSTPVVNTTGGLWVANDGVVTSGNSLIAGAGQARVSNLSFTAPMSMGVTITGLTFTKVGVLSDSNVSNLYLADTANGNVVAQFQSLSNGVATFSGLNLNVAAGQTWRGELRADISTSATSGNTIAFDLTGVTTAGNASVAGLPVKSNILTVTTVSNPSIAGLTFTFNSVGSSVDAGTNGVLVADATINVTNSPVDLQSLTYTLVGSALKSDVRNLTLKVNGIQVATAPVGSDSVVFAMGANPVRLQTGNSNVSVYADIAGSPNRTVQLTILRPYEVVARDTQYNQNITASVTTTNATSISIRTGSITVSTASDSPTNAIPAGASGVVLGKFTMYAAGEPVKVKYLQVKLTQAGGGDWSAAVANVTDDISNIRVVASDGRQVGNNISTVGGTSGTNDCALSAATYVTCNFGTSSSNINFVVPANTTTVFSVISDIGSSTNMTSLSASLVAGSSNLEGQQSYQAASSGAATGASRTVSNSPLALTLNSDLNAPTYIAGAQNVRIGSFVLTASSAQAVDVRSITVTASSTAAGLSIQNLKAMVGSTQFGNTNQTVAMTNTSLTFSGTSFSVPAGSSKVVDFYADIISNSTAATYTDVITFTNWSANGAASGSSVADPSDVAGQDVVVSSGPTITIAAGSNTAPAQNLVMGSSGNNVFTLRISNNNVDQVRVTDLTFSDTIASGATDKTSFSSFSLYDGSTLVAGPVNPVSVSATTSTVTFNLFGSGVIVEKNASKSLTLKASIPDISSNGAVSGSSHVFKILANANVTAKSVGSPSATVTVSGAPAAGNTQKVYQTKLSLSSSVTGATVNRARTGSDDLATINFGADSALQLTLGTVSLKFTGNAVASGTTAFTVDLIDANTNAALGSATQQTCTSAAGNSCSVTFAPAFIISQGDTKAVKVRVNSSSFTNTASAGDALSVLINASTDLMWADGSSTSIPVESTIVPFTVASVSYE